MATINNAITMQDKMSPVFNKMAKAMTANLTLMEKMNASANKGVTAKEFKNAKRAIDKANNAVIKFNNNLSQAEREALGVASATRRINSGGGGMGLMNAYALVGLAQQGAQLLNSATEYLDEMALMQSRVSMINDGMQTTNQLQDNILASANRARASYKDTVAAVTKLNMLASDSFKNNQEAIDFVETLNKMFTISGTSGQEATAAMYQLTQAMGAGKLQGDEFRSIMENAPMLADAIAKSMGKSKGELKELAKDGEITAEIIKKAMTEAADDVETKFAAMPMTFGQKMTILKNNFMNEMEPVAARFSMWLNSASGDAFFDTLSRSLVTLAAIGVYTLECIGNSIQFVKDNFETFKPIIIGVGLAMVSAALASAGAWLVANWPLLAIIGTAIVIAHIFNVLGIDIVNVVITIAQWLYNLGNVLYQLLPIILAVGVAALMYFVIPLIMSLPTLISQLWLAAGAFLTLNWPILLVAIAIGAVIFIMQQLGITVADVVGFIAGCFYALVAIIQNVVIIPLYNQFSMFANFLHNLFIDPIGAIQMLFLDMATYIVDKVRWVAQSLQDLVNMIPGVEINIVGNLDNIKAAIDAAKADVSAKRGVKQTEFKEYKNVGQAFNSGFSKGHNFVSSLGSGGSKLSGILDKFKMPSMPEGYGMDKGMGMFNPSNVPGISDGGKDKDKKLKGGKLDKVGKIEDKVEITDEDIKMLKDVAKAEFINKYTTLRPEMKVEFSGPIRETADINKLMEAMEDMVEEALSNTIVEGV
ncbi:tape measure protein [Clostridium perfringens]|uniref:tape measure protein n=1 Tax=Clostridium perfringens TaxID=1502 RepID=UPI0013E3D232|nr:tape measure protein [Clostridium perfringens]NGT65614.1 tape measure protein [Clostridium perfringens]